MKKYASSSIKLFFLSILFLAVLNSCENDEYQAMSEIDKIGREIDRAYGGTLKANNLPPDPPIVKKMERRCSNNDINACNWLIDYRRNVKISIERELQILRWNK